MKNIIGMFLSIVLLGCAAPIKTQEDVANSVKMKIGASDCIGCNQIKTFASGRVSSGFYSKKDDRGMNTGGWISQSIRLGITNKSAALNRQGIQENLFEAFIYAKNLTGNGHMFEGKYSNDINHPYRFFIEVHHNSSFGSYESYILDDENYIPLPSAKFQGESVDRSCFDKGCVWDETYAIPATLIKKSIEGKTPFKLFFGNMITKQVPSKDGLNKNYQTFREGSIIEIPSEYLESFVGRVDKILMN